MSSSFSKRPLRLADASAFVTTCNAISAHIGTEERIQLDSVQLEWQEPDFDLASASLGIFDAAGALAGYAIFWATSEKPVHPHLQWGVHPRYMAGGVQAELLRWGDEQGAKALERCPPEARVSLRSAAHKGFTFAEEALTKAGYSASRSWRLMNITMTSRPQPQPFPAGIATRPYRHDEDLPLLVTIIRDSFSDHYGYVEEPFEKVLALFRHWLDNAAFFDPALVVLPVDESTGEAAGCVIGLTQDRNDPSAGYIDTVGVRRGYRRRGIATAMLQQSFADFWDRGIRSLNLEVDGSSLTDAGSLYERVGMREYRRLIEYEKLLRAGIELAKTALG